MSVISAHPTFLDALRFREFRSLWLADTQSALGDQLARIAISVLVFENTSSAVWTALAFAMSYLPALLGGIFLSGLADRFPRRTVIVVCDLVRASLVLLIAIPGMPLIALCLLIAAEVIVGSLFTTAESALIPDVLPAEIYPVASALRTTTNQTCQVVGFAVGGVVVAVIGARGGLIVDSISFVASAVAIQTGVRWRAKAARTGDGIRGYLRSFTIGARTIAGNLRLRSLACFIWLVALFTVNDGVAVPYAESLGGGSIAVGLLLAATPTGTVLGAVVLTHFFTDDQRLRLLGPMAILTGIPLALCALRPGLVLTLVLWLISGVFSSYFVPAISRFTVLLPNKVRGQTVGLAASLLLTVQGAAIAGGGVVAETTGAASAVAVGGAIGSLLAATLTIRRFVYLRGRTVSA